jgi:uncharacterized protein (DUF433 family)
MSDIYATEKRDIIQNIVGGTSDPIMFHRASSALLGVSTSAGKPFLQGDYTVADPSLGTACLIVRGGRYTANIVGSSMATLVLTVGTAEPNIPGTTIPVYRITALLDGGMSIAEVMEDFPSLTADQIMWARDYANQHPNFGKSYPKKSLKRLLRNSGFVELEQTLRRRKKRS